ncbi:Uncharacterized protein DBV15_04674, partial [Temnothorax longispinosus]
RGSPRRKITRKGGIRGTRRPGGRNTGKEGYGGVFTEKGVTSLLAGGERKSGERLKLNAAETKNDRVMTAPGLTGQWLLVSLGTWTVGGPREEPCDYPSTNSRAQSGHHGPVETCNHAVLQDLRQEETLWFRPPLAWPHSYSRRRVSRL